MPWPWTLTFWPQNLISSSLSRDAPVTKVWRKSVNRYWIYRGNIKLPCESRTDGWTDGQRHERTTRKHIASAGAYRRWRLKEKDLHIQQGPLHGNFELRMKPNSASIQLIANTLYANNPGNDMITTAIWLWYDYDVSCMPASIRSRIIVVSQSNRMHIVILITSIVVEHVMVSCMPASNSTQAKNERQFFVVVVSQSYRSQTECIS